MKRFYIFLKTELKLSLRDMNMPIFAVMMPLVIFILLGIIYGARPAYNGAGYTFLEQSFGAVSAVAICASGLMGLPLAVSGLREMKILKRLRVTPVSPVFVLGVELAMYLVYCAVSLATLAVTALLWKVRLHRFTFRFSRQLGAHSALHAFDRDAGRRRSKGHEAGQRHCLDPLFPDADLLGYDAAHRGHAARDAEDRRLLPADAGTYADEAYVSGHPNGKRPAANRRHGWRHRALHRSFHPLLPLGDGLTALRP